MKNPQLQTTLPKKELDEFIKIAESKGNTASGLNRMIIVEYINKNKGKNNY